MIVKFLALGGVVAGAFYVVIYKTVKNTYENSNNYLHFRYLLRKKLGKICPKNKDIKNLWNKLQKGHKLY